MSTPTGIEPDPIGRGLTAESNRSILLQGVRIALMERDEALDRLSEYATARDRTRCVYFVNAHTVNLARRDPGYMEILNRGDLVLNDGVGVALAARMKGTAFNHNFCGTDFVPDFLEHGSGGANGANGPRRVFLLGGVPGRAEEAGVAIRARSPGIEIVGCEHGYHEDQRPVIGRIRESGADVLLVAMGNPVQESWIDRYRSELGVPLCFGVGALFDFLAGAVPRAPRIVRAMRLEWGFRFALEPRRMFSRYLIGNPLFLAHAVHDAIRS